MALLRQARSKKVIFKKIKAKVKQQKVIIYTAKISFRQQ